jgi:proline dehydrogenase
MKILMMDYKLLIVLNQKRDFKKDLNEVEKKIIECVEKDLVENLEEKAAKANLSAKNVKNIIKEVITNEDVLAYVRSAENPEDNNEPVYEPKYTRAKTK